MHFKQIRSSHLFGLNLETQCPHLFVIVRFRGYSLDLTWLHDPDVICRVLHANTQAAGDT